jgi:4,5-DOPA dioxygenase extradiol
VNEDESNPLIYDFGGFPSHFYEQKFGSKGDAGLVRRVVEVLGDGGVEVGRRKRGLDHGVWGEWAVGSLG